MECVVVQDLFLNETTNYAHVFLPGSTFLEKDGTFTNAERRIGRVRKVMQPRAGLADWEITLAIAKAMGLEMRYSHLSEIMDEIARLTPTFTGVSHDKLDRLGSVQWPCNDKAPEGTPIMHAGSFVRGKGNFLITEYVPTDERTGPRFPLLLATGRILSQYNVGAQTRRTENVVWHDEDRLEDPSPRRRAARRARRRLGPAREPRGRDQPSRARDRSSSAGRRLHNVPSSEYSGEMLSPPTIRIGRRTAPNTR